MKRAEFVKSAREALARSYDSLAEWARKGAEYVREGSDGINQEIGQRDMAAIFRLQAELETWKKALEHGKHEGPEEFLGYDFKTRAWLE